MVRGRVKKKRGHTLLPDRVLATRTSDTLPESKPPFFAEATVRYNCLWLTDDVGNYHICTSFFQHECDATSFGRPGSLLTYVVHM